MKVTSRWNDNQVEGEIVLPWRDATMGCKLLGNLRPSSLLGVSEIDLDNRYDQYATDSFC